MFAVFGSDASHLKCLCLWCDTYLRGLNQPVVCVVAHLSPKTKDGGSSAEDHYAVVAICNLFLCNLMSC